MKSPQKRGVVLLVILFLVAIVAAGALSLLGLGINTLEMSSRNRLRASALAVAESELEAMYFQFRQTVISGVPAEDTPEELQTIADPAALPSRERVPFLAAHAADGWRVRRSLQTEFAPIFGAIPGSSRTGSFVFVTARVEVLYPEDSQLEDAPPVRLGRRFVNSNSSIFQYSIFYEGDLEMNPGASIEINGDVYASGNIYMGPTTGSTLTINDTVRMLNTRLFNQRNQSGNLTTTYTTPVANTAQGNFTFPRFARSTSANKSEPQNQLERLSQPENLLGGVNPVTVAGSGAVLFMNGATPVTVGFGLFNSSVNLVNRSVITPPPDLGLPDDGDVQKNPFEYPNVANLERPDHPQINPRRAYTRASLLVEIAGAGTSPTITIFARNAAGTISNVTNKFMGTLAVPTNFITNFSATPLVPGVFARNVFDQREGRNVRVTEFNVEAFRTILAADPTFFFNGLVFFNFRDSRAADPCAIRIINGETLPVFTSGTNRWVTAAEDVRALQTMSVATNAGLYVRGSYNTQRVTLPNNQLGVPSSMLMADAITALSYAWNDANSALAIGSRVAQVDNPATPNPAVETVITINAGLITGSVPSASGFPSGGAQNLVRYLEDWRNRSINFSGSVGRIFDSTHFVGRFQQPGVVYFPPVRNYIYDQNLARFTPVGNPTTTDFSRGNMFFW